MRLSMRLKITSLVILVVAVGCYLFGRFSYDGLLNQMQRIFGLRAETAAVFLGEMVEARWGIEGEEPIHLRDGDDTVVAERVMKLIHDGYLDRVEVIRFLPDAKIEYLFLADRLSRPNSPQVGDIMTADPDDIYTERRNGHGGIDINNVPYMAGWSLLEHNEIPIAMVIAYMNALETQQAFDSVTIAILITMGAIIILSGLVAFRFASSFEKTAVTDGLMQIYNQRYFKQRLEQEVARAARYGQVTSLVMLDIDHFKKVNDTYGHATGDIVLRNLGRWVLESTRKTDVVARYGGEEVGIILPHTSLSGAQEFAERLRQFIANQLVRDPEEAAEFNVTVSVGCAQWEKGMTFLDLIRAADTALYHSKNSGRNRVSIYHEDLLPRPEKH
jgi:diguanylate cyclase (GGDEF)-like protein